ncbi:ExbD/TolR family protein [Thiohalomonas denitrificans]|uniref:Biopolymer transport protein ExbD n=1 Tax=Thiohalomonas denitrificans TaxID=415747 RepID=A0A1G5Q8H0_9GAMM|nr:biopolymer transporter ExbD [Thiohalomonas denitrificans]SCZ57559.1 biopolymer transport protein ExbD [Thiohalomonas denitrificans]
MAFGGFGTSRDEPMAEMNVIPLVDIMLVLLVIFIITAPVITHAVKVELPKASSEAAEPDERTIVLAIDAEGRILNSDEPLALDRVEATLAEAIRQDPQRELHLHTDRAATYDVIAQVMAAARRAGVVRMGFVTQPTVYGP